MALISNGSSKLNRSVAIAIPWLFLPAVLGLGFQIWKSTGLDEQCLQWAVLLLCIDQARMAQVDLKNIAAVRSVLGSANSRLERFHWVTLSTIVIELIGFYWTGCFAGFGMMTPIAGGTILVLLSQLWFHGLAGIQLVPEASEPIQTFGIVARSPVLIADTIGIILLMFWSFNIAPVGMAIALLAMVGLYGLVKYGLPLLSHSEPKHSG